MKKRHRQAGQRGREALYLRELALKKSQGEKPASYETGMTSSSKKLLPREGEGGGNARRPPITIRKTVSGAGSQRGSHAIPKTDKRDYLGKWATYDGLTRGRGYLVKCDMRAPAIGREQ